MGNGSITKEEAQRRKELLKQGIKVCSTCKRELSFDNFTKDSTTKTGLATLCKDCQKEQRKRRKSKIDRWFEDNKKHVKEQKHQYYQEHAEERIAYNSERKEYFKEKRKEYESENIEKVREQRARARKKLKARYRKYKIGAKDRGFVFELTLEEFDEMTQMPCEYCGGYSDEVDGVKFNGIDRINTLDGYVYDNCVPCCEMCNRMKMAYDLMAFLEHVKKIVNHTFGMED